MSYIEGVEAVGEKLANFDKLVEARLGEAIEAAAKLAQAEMVALVPVDEGNLRTLLASTEAMLVTRKAGKTRAEVGFRTKRLQKAGYYGLWVEFGTKAYKKGDSRAAGFDKRGRRRVQRMKRGTPARPAAPFFRPAILRLRANLEKLRTEAVVKAAADMALGRRA